MTIEQYDYYDFVTANEFSTSEIWVADSFEPGRCNSGSLSNYSKDYIPWDLACMFQYGDE